MDHQEKHKQHKQQEHEQKKKEHAAFEQQHHKKGMLPFHPGWLIGGVLFAVIAMLVWTFAFPK